MRILSTALIAVLIPAAAMGLELLSVQAPDSGLPGVNPREDIVLVQAYPFTEYTFWGFPPGQYGIQDLQPGMRVAVEGEFDADPELFHAIHVHAGFEDGGPRTGGSHPSPPPCEGVYGWVETVEPGLLQFNVMINFQSNYHQHVVIPPDAELYLAFPDTPLMPIGVSDLFPNMPVMIHGFFDGGDVFIAEALVVSDDWCPEEPESNTRTTGDEKYEIYGTIFDIWMGGQNTADLIVDVSTMTGDPNHQSFSRYVDVHGGRFEFPWGYLDFPFGALNQGEWITVSGDFMFWWTLYNVYTFEPHGIYFNSPVTIEIRYFNLDGIDPSRINLSYFDPDLGRWVIATHMTHDPDRHCFTGEIEHFSRYSLSTNNRPLEQLLEQE